MSVGDGWDLPQGAEPYSDFHWFQPSTKGDLDLVILSLKPNWYTGHFVGGRMVPCAGSGCDICSLGIGGQVRYVFACAETSSHRCGLIELGRGNGMLLRDWSDRYGGLRGLRIDVRKHSKSLQSRTEIIYVEETAGQWFLALKVPDPALALYLTWKKMNVAIPESFDQRMREECAKIAYESPDEVKKQEFMRRAKSFKKARQSG